MSEIASPQLSTGFARRRLRVVNATFALGMAGLLAIGLSALFAPLIAKHDPLAIDILTRLQPPSWEHPFGTDELGRDNFARVLFGGRLSLVTALAAVGIASSVGVTIGLISGYFGGWLDAVLSRAMDFLLAIPAILLAIVIIAVLGPSRASALVAVATVSIPQFARLARAGVLALKPREFVQASVVLGARHTRVLLRTILPNVLSPIIVQCAITAATAILLEAALSFLGLGTQPPEPGWGLMLSTAQSYLQEAPWYGLFPGLAVTVTVLSLDAIARGLNRGLSGRGS
jgi:peptide/nickel transport system permease protein